MDENHRVHEQDDELGTRGDFARPGDRGQTMKDLQTRVGQGLSRSHTVLQRCPHEHHTN